MEQQKRNSSVFGILCLVAAVLGWRTPRLLLDFMYMAIFGFGLIGIIRDGRKVWSIAGMVVGGLLVYAHASTVISEEQVKNKMYLVRYEAACRMCDVSYTNSTGGTDRQESLPGFSYSVPLRGDDYVNFSAQNSIGDGEVTARLYVNDLLVKTETSSGRYAVASVSGSISRLATGQ